MKKSGSMACETCFPPCRRWAGSSDCGDVIINSDESIVADGARLAQYSRLWGRDLDLRRGNL